MMDLPKANLKETRAGKEHLNEEMLAKLEAKTDANQEKMDAWIAEIKAWRTETMVCQEATDTCLESKEPTNMESITGHEEVHKEEVTVQPVRALKKRHGDRHPAIGCIGKPKKQTQGNGGPQRELAAAGRGMTHRAGVAWFKGRGHTGQLVEQGKRKKRTREHVAREAS
jgi:hypothetical protein